MSNELRESGYGTIRFEDGKRVVDWVKFRELRRPSNEELRDDLAKVYIKKGILSGDSACHFAIWQNKMEGEKARAVCMNPRLGCFPLFFVDKNDAEEYARQCFPGGGWWWVSEA